ncbi:MAG: cation:proton antiporter [Candidatus Sumerlaeia bacterium]|nr:cation:proton antiporter [Candidatus Sumerlaeia bacterium]
MSHYEITQFLLSLGILLGFARMLGELARYFHQPAVLGELLAGIILGPTLLGTIAPEINAALFPREGAVALARESIGLVGVVLFLLIAGMEVDLSMVFRQRKAAFFVSATGMIFPFVTGFALAYYLPTVLMDMEDADNHFLFALFFGTAMAISALPVICKTLLDLNLFKTDLGMIIISSAIIDDLTGWMIFAIILGMMGTTGADPNVAKIIVLTLAFATFMLTVGRWAINMILPWLQAHLSWPSGVMGFAITCAMLCAAFTEWIGIHAIFGSFLFGIALGDSRHLRERTRTTLDQFISTIFAPIFFASIGLKVNFIENFAPVTVAVVLIIATIGKVIGCWIGARMGGMKDNEAWAVGFGMNARGAMEIILGLLALKAGLIDQTLFVALVIMALVTSMTSGTMMQRLLRREKQLDFLTLLSPRSFGHLKSKTREDAIKELTHILCTGTSLNEAEVHAAVWAREQTMPTGLANHVAIPHARMPKLTTPMIAVGLSREGIDFDASDGSPARVIFLILTPQEDSGAQLQILAGIGKACMDPALVRRLSDSENFTQLLATLKAKEAPLAAPGHAH